MSLLKPGGFIFLSHKINEGKRVYNGLHQWNFCQKQGKFVIWKMGQEYIVGEHLPQLGEEKIEEYDHSSGKMIDVWLFLSPNIPHK